MWLVTLPVSPRINQYHAVSLPKCRNVAAVEPIFHALREAILKHQVRTDAVNLIMEFGFQPCWRMALSTSLSSFVPDRRPLAVLGRSGDALEVMRASSIPT